MADTAGESLLRLQGLQRDLTNLSSTTLHNIDRLWSELQAQLDDFRELLDKKSRNEQSRKTLNEAKDTLKLDDVEYRISDAFKQQAVELADALDLDELSAAKLLADAQADAIALDRTPLATAIIVFHQRRQFLLECLRLALEKAYTTDSDLPEELQGHFQGLVPAILHSGEGESAKGSAYWRKCVAAMEALQKTIHQVSERVQSVSVTNQPQSQEFQEIMSFQSLSMLKQHESLGAILQWLARGNWTGPEDLRFFVNKAKVIDRYDESLVHYLPGLLALVTTFASSDAHCSLQEAKAMSTLICSKKDSDTWALRSFQAGVTAVWLAEYAVRFADAPNASDETGSAARDSLFAEALKDGAFHFLLTIGSDVKGNEWYDPARKGLTSFLVQDAPALQAEPFHVEPFTVRLILDRLQNFADAYISNMPDSLRQLRFDEDEQRRQVQNISQSRPAEFDLNLERFLLIIACAFEENQVAAEAFWDDADSNLYGFLQWSSQRQSTPRAAAFCEMLSAISRGSVCANHAHRFLLDESAMASAKLRRSSPLSWNHILREIEVFAATFKNRPSGPVGAPAARNTYGEQIEEPESELMLECYLRLISHLARESSEARAWLLTTTIINLPEHLILLCASGISSRTRACAFATISCLLTEKDDATHKAFWVSIDAWIHGQSQNTIAPQGRVPQSLTPHDMERYFCQNVSGGFEEPNSVVVLFTSLIAPGPSDPPLSSSLPFPEDLGAKYRMAGIESYVDFVMNDTFARKSFEIQDPIQLRIIRINCLNFADLCLGTFNESLLLLANQTNVPVDSAIATSSLTTYVKLHPFARVMEWMFNDAVIAALFAAAMQDIDEVNAASEAAPLVQSLLKSLRVVDMVLALQTTYFDLVRPLVKMQAPSRRSTVANSALASFEDAVLNHMELVRMLGIYSGSGHTSLATASLLLLERLSRSRKLVTPIAGGTNRRTEKSRLITALERDGEAENVSRSLAAIMQYDEREAEIGPESPGIVIKRNILQFLAGSLETMADRPTIAHVMLGFACDSHSLYVANDGLYSDGTSLLHRLISFIVACPDGASETFVAWLLQIKSQAMQILQRLWRSRLSSALMLEELRRADFVLNMAVQQAVIQPDSLWNGVPLDDPAFFVRDSSAGLAALLQSRSAFLECAATELRYAKTSKMSTLRARIQDSLFGSTTLLDGQQFVNPAIFEYLDFLDIDVGGDLAMPVSTYFPENLLDNCKEQKGEHGYVYNMSNVQQLLQLRQNDLRYRPSVPPSYEGEQLQADVANIEQVAIAHNQRLEVVAAKGQALQSWIQLCLVMLDCCDLTSTQRIAFVLQLLQQSLPWLEKSYAEDMSTSVALARFGLSLLRHVDFKTFSSETNLATDTANDRLYQLFRAAAMGLQFPESSITLRETCAQICRCYIQNVSHFQKQLLKRTLSSLKTIGESLLETICDDACTGEGQVRTSSLLLLESIVIAANQTKTPFVLEAFNRLNFVSVIANSLRDLPNDLIAGGSEMLGTVVSFYRMSLGLLLRISQTRAGAAHVFNAGFFNAVRDSGIFMVDPDIGLDIDNPSAMTKYLELLVSFTRVVNAIVISRGPESDKTIGQGRLFLHEYRATIVSILKRNAGIGASNKDNKAVLEQLVDSFTVLMSATAFLETDEDKLMPADAPRLFS